MNKLDGKTSHLVANTKLKFSHLGHAFRVPMSDFMVGGDETILKGLYVSSLCGYVDVSLVDLKGGGNLNTTCSICIEAAKILDIHV